MEQNVYVNQNADFEWFGKHLLIDLKYINKDKVKNVVDVIECLNKAVAAAGATILHTHFHDFGNGGFSGVLVLSESHLSLHYWPERGYVGMDIFMCGNSDPFQCLPHICEFFQPKTISIIEQKRGLDFKR